MTPERQAEIIAAACKQAGVDSHIRWIERRKEAQTWAEKIAVQFMRAGQQFPVKNSYMFCDTLDMCFFYGPGDTPKGHAGADERDITEGNFVEAFRKADTVLRLMKNSQRRSSMKVNMDKLSEMDGHWNEVMELAARYGFVVQAYGGTATLATHKNQLEAYRSENYILRQRNMNKIEMEVQM